MEELANAGLDIAEVRKDYVIALVTDSALKSLTNRAVRYQVVNETLTRFFQKEQYPPNIIHLNRLKNI